MLMGINLFSSPIIPTQGSADLLSSFPVLKSSSVSKTRIVIGDSDVNVDDVSGHVNPLRIAFCSVMWVFVTHCNETFVFSFISELFFIMHEMTFFFVVFSDPTWNLFSQSEFLVCSFRAVPTDLRACFRFTLSKRN